MVLVLTVMDWHLADVISPELVVPDPQAPVYAAIAPWSERQPYYLSLLYSVGQAYGFEIQTLWNQLTEEQHIILYGSEKSIWIEERNDHRRYMQVLFRCSSDSTATVRTS